MHVSTGRKCMLMVIAEDVKGRKILSDLWNESLLHVFIGGKGGDGEKWDAIF